MKIADKFKAIIIDFKEPLNPLNEFNVCQRPRIFFLIIKFCIINIKKLKFMFIKYPFYFKPLNVESTVVNAQRNIPGSSWDGLEVVQEDKSESEGVVRALVYCL